MDCAAALPQLWRSAGFEAVRLALMRSSRELAAVQGEAYRTARLLLGWVVGGGGGRLAACLDGAAEVTVELSCVGSWPPPLLLPGLKRRGAGRLCSAAMACCSRPPCPLAAAALWACRLQ